MKPWRERMWGLNQKRRQKVLNGRVSHLHRGTWHSKKLIKSLLIYSILYLNWGAELTNALRGDRTDLNFSAVITEMHINN